MFPGKEKRKTKNPFARAKYSGDLKHRAKFQNPRTTPSGEKVGNPERWKKVEK
jgi:hypothetical protein